MNEIVWSLNDLLEILIRRSLSNIQIHDLGGGKYEERNPPAVDWKLSPEMPKIYVPQSVPQRLVSELISSLEENIFHHNAVDRMRVETRSGTMQTLEFAWDAPLSPERIAEINSRYGWGRQLKEKPTSGMHLGTRAIGYCVAQLGGRVKIENFRDGLYVVRNVVELPLNLERASAEASGRQT